MNAMAVTKTQMLKELDLPTTHEPWGDEIAGQPPQPAGGGLEALLAGGGGGMPGQGGQMPPGMEGQLPPGMQPDMMQGGGGGGPQQDPAMEQERPRGRDGRGAQGPRKSLKDLRTAYKKRSLLPAKKALPVISEGYLKTFGGKSMYFKVREALANGHA